MFSDNKNGTIIDTETGLMWQQATAPGTYTWNEAMEYCKNLNLAGCSDWRLPAIHELRSIVIKNNHPAINNDFFSDTVASYYWSFTTHAYGTNYAWLMYFGHGDDLSGYKSSNYYVRAVRGGRVGALDDSVISELGKIKWTPANNPPDTGRPTNPLYAEIDRLRAEIDELKNGGWIKGEPGKTTAPIFQTDPEKLYAWLTELYRVIDAFPEFVESNLYETERAIVDCRELKKRCSDAFNEYGLEWMLNLEINFGGGSIE